MRSKMSKVCLLKTTSCLLSEQRRFNQHRCVTPLYHIPLGIFNCVIGKAQIVANEICIFSASV